MILHLTYAGKWKHDSTVQFSNDWECSHVNASRKFVNAALSKFIGHMTALEL